MKKEFVFRLVLAFSVFFLVYQYGIKPIFGYDFIYQSRHNNTWAAGKLSSDKSVYDMVVAGEEPDGIAAAISAARVGAKVLLISGRSDLGGVISHGLVSDLQINTGSKGEELNGGIAKEINKIVDSPFTIEKYKKAVTKLVNDESNISVIYNAKNISAVLENSVLTAVEAVVDGEKKKYTGKRFIDSTRDGDLLLSSGVPFLSGSEDLNLKNSFMPVTMNFELENADWTTIKNLIKFESVKLKQKLNKYRVSDVNIRMNDFNAYNQENGRVVIQSIEVANVNVLDKTSLSSAYETAAKEAKNLSAYLSTELEEFRTAKLARVADELQIKESRHFTGEDTLSTIQILENQDSTSKIAVASSMVLADKFADGKRYIVNKPIQYAIPFGCIVPKKVDNLLMTGAKISYSSLAASSAGSISTGIATGEAAGVAAVYSLISGITPRQIVKDKSVNRISDVQKLLKRQGVRINNYNVKVKVEENWAYPQLKELLSLGLVAGGAENDYKFDSEAKQEDLAILLLNGIFRLAPEKYNLELDNRLRKLFTNDKLTPDKAAETLAALYGVKDGQDVYKAVCEKGYINNTMAQKLKGKKVLNMEDVYYLAASNIKQYTGKMIDKSMLSMVE